MFAGKAKSLRLSGAPEWCLNRVGTGFIIQAPGELIKIVLAEISTLDFALLIQRSLNKCADTYYFCYLGQGILKGKYHCTIDLLFDWFG
jgi:hypothetical protein